MLLIIVQNLDWYLILFCYFYRISFRFCVLFSLPRFLKKKKNLIYDVMNKTIFWLPKFIGVILLFKL